MVDSKLRYTRKEKEISVADLAKELSVTKATYYNYEKHPETITVEKAYAIAKVLGVKPADLFFEDIN